MNITQKIISEPLHSIEMANFHASRLLQLDLPIADSEVNFSLLMKNWIASLILLVPFLLSAQTGTTLEEYRFMSKGYAYQKSMGLDASKTGYEIRNIGPATKQVAYMGLYANGAANPQAILLILQKENVKPVYLCLPNNQANKQVLDLYEIDRKEITDPAVWQLYDTAMRQLAFYLLGGQSENNALVSTNSEMKIEEYATEKMTSKGANNMESSNSTKGSTLTKAMNAVTGDRTEEVPDSYHNTEKTNRVVTEEHIEERINTGVAINLDELLTRRGVLKAPVIKGSYAAKGKVAIKFCVDKDGTVSSSKFTQMGSTTFNKALVQRALDSVEDAAFAKSDEMECGKAVFHFQ